MVKKVVKKEKQKQSQKQAQNVKQTVIIKLDKEGKRKKVKRRKPRREPSDGVSTFERALPPPVIYQGSYPVPFPIFREAPKVKTINEEPVPKGFLEDIGQVGTEGAVQILEPAEPQYVNLVEKPKKIAEPKPSFQYDYPVKPDKVGEELESLAEMIRNAGKPRTFIPPMIEAEKRTRRTKKEMEEARQMGREDIASINLGLYQFEPSFEKPQISKGLNEQQESEPIKQEQNIPESFTPLFAESRIEKPLSKTGKPIESLMTAEDITQEQNIPEI